MSASRSSTLDEIIEKTIEETAIDVEKLQEGVEEEGAQPDGDPCNSYAWSICFLLLLIMAIAVMVINIVALVLRRKNISGMDLIHIFFYPFIIIQFGIMLSQVLHAGHNIYHFSQTGCKLMFYTEYGLRHCFTFLVLAALGYAWQLSRYSGTREDLDARLRSLFPWFLLLLVCIEAIFGMSAAVYVDVHPLVKTSCVWTPTLNLTFSTVMTQEILLRPIFPYVIPFVVIVVPLVFFSISTVRISDKDMRSVSIHAVVLVWSYFICNLPYAIVLLAESGSMITQKNYPEEVVIDWPTLCNFKWAFFLLHQSWYLWMCVLALVFDSLNGNSIPGFKFIDDVIMELRLRSVFEDGTRLTD